MEGKGRLNFLLACFLFFGFLILLRLYYWQIISGEELAAAAEGQHQISFEIPAKRGEILAKDGFPLAASQEAYLVFASIPDLQEPAAEIASQLAPLFAQEEEATPGGKRDLAEARLSQETLIKERLNRTDLNWVPLAHKISHQLKTKIEALAIAGLGFEEEQQRSYPEGSSSAHLLGFVGQDIDGRDQGYFGLEGYYNLELKGRTGLVRREKDALGRPILVGQTSDEKEQTGRDLLTTLDRSVQYIVERNLAEGLKRYGATSGSVVVMEPTGAILAMASWPGYEPGQYWQYDKTLFSNPNIAFAYEPGSTFKIAVMAAALNEKVVKPETKCEQCTGPRVIGEYVIKTWNEVYFPESTMIEVIEHSDNVGMVFVGEKLGKEKMVEYLQRFGLGEKTGIDLEDESVPALRPQEKWSQIDLATASFGQGVALTPLQMIRIAATIANNGQLVRPYVVKEIRSEEKTTQFEPKLEREVITPATAKVMTEMMVNAVEKGEAKWAKPAGYRIAGKTGTAEIPVAGHYDEEKTIASFVGFAPADDPKFVMLVTLREPTSSPWGSETAAPLWFQIAKELFNYYGVLPE
ncbi:MAG: penicillin-binding protein 2 [Candidatus Marinimicrobia bacterium]|nr:penicillin-binding protein 2 [Candidatus Neomarinimicrobiota bacterium]